LWTAAKKVTLTLVIGKQSFHDVAVWTSSSSVLVAIVYTDVYL